MHERQASIDDLQKMRSAAERALTLADACGESLIAIRLNESVVVIDDRIDVARKQGAVEPENGRARPKRTEIACKGGWSASEHARRDPTGSAEERHAMTREIEGTPAPEEGIVATLFIVVADVERSTRFYRDVLGATITRAADPAIVRFANIWIIMNPGGGPTLDKPAITLDVPAPGATVSAFMNVRVADIDAVHREWSSRGASFLTPPLPNGDERRCYVVDPDGHLIEVGEHVVM